MALVCSVLSGREESERVIIHGLPVILNELMDDNCCDTQTILQAMAGHSSNLEFVSC